MIGKEFNMAFDKVDIRPLEGSQKKLQALHLY